MYRVVDQHSGVVSSLTWLASMLFLALCLLMPTLREATDACRQLQDDLRQREQSVGFDLYRSVP